ncbi:porin family protein [Cesiribacter andamanensis]|uniref:Outer membrane protein beta-barrel domain-containing protein n=1 Tax=Cesiribacter andamanensis AMV16 TaxID=1279009 RepID=M7NM26_9BACT|nr:porin family protein [Cesiribacter andamanensis]EMR02815.1 hypothetical protein ADICEAN_02023 [Cesiribacter andamanensis AMV16]
MAKPLFFLLGCLLTFSSAGVAQVVFGLKGGPGYADVVALEKGKDSKTGRLAYQAGMLVKKQLQERVGLQAELLYSNKGQEGYFVHALGIPLLVCYRPLELLELEAGLNPSYNLLSTDDNSSNIRSMQAQAVDIALLAGTRYFISNRLGLNTRLGWGLLNALESVQYVGENNSLVRVEKSGLRHASIMLSLEYYF